MRHIIPWRQSKRGGKTTSIAFRRAIIYSKWMVVVLGKHGQVAHAISVLHPEFCFLSSSEAPFTEPQKVLAHLDRLKPKCVINAAAYTAVDKAESERELSLQINAHTPGLMAQWCKTNGVPLIHYSTDYVFDGTGEKPWVESDATAPVNWYGHTKLEGEKQIQESGCEYYIFRVSWIYSDVGHNFAKTIRRLAQEKKELRIVNDQWGSPTKAEDIAKVTTALAEKIITPQARPKPGLYHLRFRPFMTWFDFANEIIEDARQKGLPVVLEKLIPIRSEEFPTPAQRPKNSRLDTLYAGAFLKKE